MFRQRQHPSIFFVYIFITYALCACTPQAPINTSGLQAVTPVPTLDTSDPTELCEAASVNWDNDWPATIRALEALEKLEAQCPGEPATRTRLYTAYLTFGKLLEGDQQMEAAVQAYLSALSYQPTSNEALEALTRLNIIPPTPPSDCEATDENVPVYRPSSGTFIEVNGSYFSLSGQPFIVYGIDYYPRDTPWRRFLSETNPEHLKPEFRLLREAGINTLRITLRHDLLFQCAGQSDVPVREIIERLDEIIRQATRYGFRLIMVLNDAPDLTAYPLYSSPRHTVAQMTYLAERYQDEPTILAWDLREAGDLDYLNGRVERQAVLEWLAETSVLMQQADPNHLITASWAREAEATIGAVDFISFQTRRGLDDLRQTIAILKAATSQPILLSSTGFGTFGNSEEGQRDSLQAALDAARNNQLAGWVVWTAFDFPLTVTCYEPDCVSQDSSDHHFGLWTREYEPKLAVGVIELATGVK